MKNFTRAALLAATILSGGLAYADLTVAVAVEPFPWDRPDWREPPPAAAAQPANRGDSAQSKAENQRKEAEARKRAAEKEKEKEQARIAEEKEQARKAEEEKARTKEQAFAKAHAEAEKGDIVAQYNLGKMYMEGIVTDKDRSKAATWFEKAINYGKYNGCTCSGGGYCGVPQKELKDVCESARNDLVTIYMQDGISRDHIYILEEIFRNVAKCSNKQYHAFYKTLGEQGETTAQNNLGIMYADEPYNCPKDMTQSIYWFGKAANRGIQAAQYNLGLAFLSEKKYDRAVYWFRQAANDKGYTGYPPAINALGVMYYNGHGVDFNPGRARELIALAGNKGNASANLNMQELNKIDQDASAISNLLINTYQRN